MLLSHEELCELCINGTMENAPLELVNGTSIDVTLAPKILVEAPPGKLVIPPELSLLAPSGAPELKARQVIDYRRRTKMHMEVVVLPANGDGWIMLEPGAFILCSSEQIFNLPADLSCEYKLKSSMARIGLEHLNAGWCDPGWHGSALTLEFKNVTRYHHIVLRPGDRIGQVVFFRHKPVSEEHGYGVKGRYNNDRTVTGIKP